MNAYNISFFIKLTRFQTILKLWLAWSKSCQQWQKISTIKPLQLSKEQATEEDFKQIFQQIQNLTKKLNKTVSHINELVAVWSETTIKFNKDVKSLEEKTGQNQEDIEDLERKLTEKIDKLELEVKTLKV